MADFVLQDGDKVIFMPAFGAAMVVVKPGKISGSGPAMLNGKKACVAGDEKGVSVPGCLYTAGSFVTPGNGTLKIEMLKPEHKSKKVKVKAKEALLKGKGNFMAVFEVQGKAIDPSTGSPDPVPKYSGQGKFISSNIKTSAT